MIGGHPPNSYDGIAARALLETGPVALEYLIPILHDANEAPLWGSADATASHGYGYRRKDFAYRYVLLIRGEKPFFDAAPDTRDERIIRLQRQLEARKDRL